MRTKDGGTTVIRALANPVAYRIVHALAPHGPQTTAQLAQRLSDVPTSSLYRQLSRLRSAGIISVVSERKIRGTVERTYKIARPDAAALNAETPASLPLSETRAALRNFIASFVADVTTFVESHAFTRRRDNFGAALLLCKFTDDDFVTAMREIRETISRARARSAQSSAATLRSFYVVALPAKEDR